MRLMKWLGMEANARAVMTLLAIGAAVGGGGKLVVENIAPMLSPSLSISSYGDGYRSGRREAELEQRVAALEAQLRLSETMRDIEQETANMSPEDIQRELQDGTF